MHNLRLSPIGRIPIGGILNEKGYITCFPPITVRKHLIFLIFDVELIFLFPIAVAYSKLSLFAVISTITFVLILLLGLFLEWKKGALEWD